MQILVNNTHSALVFDKESVQEQIELRKLIHEQLDPLDPARFNISAFRRGFWDGRKAIFNQKDNTFPTGLVEDMRTILYGAQRDFPNLSVSVIDQREAPIKPKKMDKTITLLNGKQDPIIMDPKDPVRGYQYKAVKAALDEQRMIVNASTNSGKTEIAAGLIKENLQAIKPDDMIFFMSHTVSIAEQSQARIEKRLGIPVGFWGNGRKDLKKVNSVMVKTIANSLKSPESVIKLTSQKDKALQQMATKFVPILTQAPNVRTTIKMFLKNNQPKYIYQEPIFTALTTILMESKSDEEARQALLSYAVAYKDLLRSKNKKVFDDYAETRRILDKVKVIIVDECLTANSLITMSDNSVKPIEQIKVGDQISGGTVKHVEVRNPSEIMEVTHNYGVLKGTLTHPVATLTPDKDIVYKPLMQLKKGDELLLQDPVKTSNDPLDYKDKDIKLMMFFGLIAGHAQFPKPGKSRKKDKDGNPFMLKAKFFSIPLTKTPEYVEWVHKTVADGLEVVREREGIIPKTTESLSDKGNLRLKIRSEAFMDYVESTLGLSWKTSERAVPNFILNDPKLLSGFMVGYLGSFGTYLPDQVTYTTPQYGLLNALMMWLHSHGQYPTCFTYPRRVQHSTMIAFDGPELEWLNTLPLPLLKPLPDFKNKRGQYLNTYKGYIISRVQSTYVLNGQEKTYDMEVDPTHTFIANEVLNHNCHHAVASTYQEVLGNLPNARQRIGLSGSIDQKDTIKWTILKGTFSDKLFKVTNKEMIDKGVSAKPLISFVPVMQPDNLEEEVEKQLPVGIPDKEIPLTRYRIAYDLGVKNSVYRNQLIATLANELSKRGDGGILIVVNTIEHGELIQKDLEAKGNSSYFLQGSVTSINRHVMLSDVESGKQDILIGTSVIDEGIDLPNLKYLIYASAGSSLRVVLQRVGRVLRTSKTKKSTLIFDLVDRTHPLLFKQAQKRYEIYRQQQFTFLNNF